MGPEYLILIKMYESKTVDSLKKNKEIKVDRKDRNEVGRGEEKNRKLRELNNQFLSLTKFFLSLIFYFFQLRSN